MFTQLKNYYIVVSAPFLLLLLGAAYFNKAVMLTISRNPHPQINYAIFVIILFGGVLIITSAHKLVKEAKIIVEFSEYIRSGLNALQLQEIANRYTGDISYILQMVAASIGRPIPPQEQAAINNELSNARARLIRRNALPQYLTGLLVGMGLLGTFVGLLATLSDISVLISSFAELDMATASPLVVFRTMIERMKAPMQSMSIAFSASMFGLLGSIVLGLMMLGIRRIQGDISSMLNSEVARHIELALSLKSTEKSQETVAKGQPASIENSSKNCEEYAVLIRIEERLAESTRQQQRILATEIEEFTKQHNDLIQALVSQNESNVAFRTELKEIARQFTSLVSNMEKNSTTVSTQISDLTVATKGGAKETVSLLAAQIDEQQKLRSTIDSYHIEERLEETAHSHQRILESEIDDFQKQRSDLIQALSQQTDASNSFQNRLEQLGMQLGNMTTTLNNRNESISEQLSELTVQIATGNRQSETLLNMQLNEQRELKQILDWRNTKNQQQ